METEYKKTIERYLKDANDKIYMYTTYKSEFIDALYQHRKQIRGVEAYTPETYVFAKQLWNNPDIKDMVSDTLDEKTFIDKVFGFYKQLILDVLEEQQPLLNGILHNENWDNIKKIELEYISSYVQKTIDKQLTIKQLQDINRGILDEYLKDEYYLYNVQKAFEVILLTLFNLLSVPQSQPDDNIVMLNKDIRQWLTRLYIPNINSAIGMAVFNGFYYMDNNLVLKTVQQKRSNSILVHEYYIGLYMNEMRKYIPNFMYTYGLFKCGTLIPEDPKSLCETTGDTNFLLLEYIKGESLLEYVKNKSLKEIYTVLFQIVASLHMANEKFGFIHKDLHAGNIIIRPLKHKTYIKYDMFGSSLYLLCDNIATFIDYGYSEIVNPDKNIKMNYNYYPNDCINNIGYDIYHIFDHVNSLIDVDTRNNDYNNFRSIFTNTYTSLGIPSYLVRCNLKLLKLKPGIFLKSLIDILSNTQSYSVYKPDFFIDNIPRYDIVINENPLEPSYNKVIENIQTPYPQNKCSLDPWKLGKFMDTSGNEKSWFDCGNFFYDGKYNVVEFDEGLPLYTGDKITVYQNWIIDKGLNFFITNNGKFTPEEIKLLDDPTEPKDIKDKLVESKIPLSISILGDIYYAREISEFSKCFHNCISAYISTSKAKFIDLFNPANILVLLRQINYKKFPELLDMLKKMYNINETDILDNSKLLGSNVKSITDESRAYIILDSFIPFINGLYEPRKNAQKSNEFLKLLSIVNSQGYAGFSFHGIRNFSQPKLIFGNTLSKFIRRDFSNTNDWQYFNTKRLYGEIGKLIEDMKNYKTYNINDQQGDLFEHSVWVALTIQDFFTDLDKQDWVNGIETYKNLCIISGFLHDIGKAGDLVFNFYEKDNHIERGLDYVMGRQEYKLKNNKVLDIPKILSSINISVNDQKILGFIILTHHDIIECVYKFINLSKSEDDEDIKDDEVQTLLNKFISYLPKVGLSYTDETLGDYITLITIAIMMAICIHIGENTYINQKTTAELNKLAQTKKNYMIKDMNSFLTDFPYITNQPRVHKGKTMSVDEINKILTSGKELKNICLYLL